MPDEFIRMSPSTRRRLVDIGDGTFADLVATVEATASVHMLFVSGLVIPANQARTTAWMNFRLGDEGRFLQYASMSLMMRAITGSGTVTVEESDDGVTPRSAEDGGPWNLGSSARLNPPNTPLRAPFVRIRVVAASGGLTLGQNSLLLVK